MSYLAVFLLRRLLGVKAQADKKAAKVSLGVLVSDTSHANAFVVYRSRN